MSIQQSVNQTISGSLFLLNQTAAFQRMKAFRAAKKDAERDAEVDKPKNEDSDGSQTQVTGNIPRNSSAHPLSKDEMEASLTEQLSESVKEAEQARKKSEEFRKMVLQGVYRKEDRMDGK